MKIPSSFVGCLSLLLASCASIGQHGKIEPSPKVDLSRYMGSWHVIAFVDNKLERDFYNAVESYRLRGSNQVDVHFTWNDKGFDGPLKTHDFTGRVVADGTNAKWKMRLLPPFSASYIIVDVAPDYSRVAVAHPSRKFGWILARDRTISEAHYQEYMRLFGRLGYDTSKFVRAPQKSRQ